MVYIIVAVILLIVGVIGILVRATAGGGERRSDEGDPKFAGTVIAVIGFVALGIWTVAMSATTVSARSVGIQTAFGRYQSTLPAGFHWTSPWSGVEEFSTQVQYLELNGGEHGNGGVAVNYKGGGQGVVDATVRWRIDQANAEQLWRKYREFGKVRDQLVVSSTRDSVRVVVGPYAPNDARAGQNLRPITGAVQADLTRTLADDGVDIDSVSVTAVLLDDNTQRSLEKVVAAQNDIERAKADKARAEIDAQTAKIREQSGSLSPGALQRYCLEVTNSWDHNKNGELPATWNCFAGSQQPVVVGGK
jgi:regulator of protease activity HflC (stomatin/prohibitin superfamily)